MQTNIDKFDPEDGDFWANVGRSIAIRNLIISCVCLSLSFVVWFLWSILVLYLKDVGFNLSTGQLFTLMAIPMISGAIFRFLYSFVIPIFGGRNWTVFSTASLLIPIIGIGAAVQNQTTEYETLVFLAWCTGLGGGNFSSSMANIQLFFPKRLQGIALGTNAGLGNLGVSILQFFAPLSLSLVLYEPITGGALKLSNNTTQIPLYLQNVAYIWVVPIIIATIAAFFGMNNLKAAKYSFKTQINAFRNRHMYIIICLYTMSFGSFVGFSALFPLTSKLYFPETNAENLVFLGPMIGSLIRPFGGWISDKYGGAKVTFWTTLIKIFAAMGVIYFLPKDSRLFVGFFLTFLLVFLMSGIANASIFRMVPFIFPTAEAGAVLGISSAVASYGAYLIPRSFSLSLKHYDTITVALWWIVAFYVFCIGLMWWNYVRKNAPVSC